MLAQEAMIETPRERPCTCTRGTGPGPRLATFHFCPAHGAGGTLDRDDLEWWLRRFPQRQAQILAVARAQGVEPSPEPQMARSAPASLPRVEPIPCECGSALSAFDYFPVSRRLAFRCGVCGALEIVEEQRARA